MNRSRSDRRCGVCADVRQSFPEHGARWILRRRKNWGGASRRHKAGHLGTSEPQALPSLRRSTIIGVEFSIRATTVVASGTNNWQLRDCERIIAGKAALLDRKHVLIGTTRLRNEALILRDTLDYVGKHVDAIIAYDDASTDRTLEILRSHPKVALVVTNGSWEEDVKARRLAEGRHRGLLLQMARARLQFDWMFCFDADERVIGDLRGFAGGPRARDCDAVRVRLFDAYMTPDGRTSNCWAFVGFSARNSGTS